MNIFDYVNAPEMAAYITEKYRTSNQTPLLGATLFPKDVYNGTDISWLKGADSLPVSINPSNYDAKATMRERTSFGKMSTEMAFFREATKIGEKERQEINKLLYHPSSALALPIIRNIFDDVARIAEGVDIQAEYMRMQLLQYGKFTVKSLDETAVYTYDYNMASDHKISVTDKWNQPAGSDPVQDIIDACDKAETATGVRPTRAIMNRNTFKLMCQTESVRKALCVGLRSDSWQALYMSDQEVQGYIEAKTGVSIAIYNKMYTTLDAASLIPNLGAAKTFVDDGKVILLPPTTLGKTWFGTTPEQSDAMSGALNGAQVATLANGSTLTTYREPHPVNVVQIVSACMIPSFEMINNVYVLTVK